MMIIKIFQILVNVYKEITPIDFVCKKKKDNYLNTDEVRKCYQ